MLQRLMEILEYQGMGSYVLVIMDFCMKRTCIQLNLPLTIFIYTTNNSDCQRYLCGRRKDLIIIAGRNFYPQDIEEVVESANRHIRPGCVIVFELEIDDQEALVILAEVRDPKLLKDQDLQTIADDVSLNKHLTR